MKKIHVLLMFFIIVVTSCKKESLSESGLYFNVSSSSEYAAAITMEVENPKGNRGQAVEHYTGVFNFTTSAPASKGEVHASVVCNEGQVIDYILKIKGKIVQPTAKYHDSKIGFDVVLWDITAP